MSGRFMCLALLLTTIVTQSSAQVTPFYDWAWDETRDVYYYANESPTLTNNNGARSIAMNNPGHLPYFTPNVQ